MSDESGPVRFAFGESTGPRLFDEGAPDVPEQDAFFCSMVLSAEGVINEYGQLALLLFGNRQGAVFSNKRRTNWLALNLLQLATFGRTVQASAPARKANTRQFL